MERPIAKAIIHKLGSFGTPPEFGIEYFSVGLEPYLQVIEQEYFEDLLPLGLSSFKLITGNYGGGKTHFLYLIRELAWKHRYATSYVSLSATECPFDRLELVYKRIAATIAPPPDPAQRLQPGLGGIGALLRSWYLQAREDRDYLSRIRNLESMSFTNALKAALMNLQYDDEDGFNALVQWLQAEDIPRDIKIKHRISERVDRTTAFRMLRSLIQFVSAAGYRGLILLFDEAERGMSISSARDKRRALDNLRQVIDECGNSRLPGAMFFYAVPDENLLLEGAGGAYEALKQRLHSSFTKGNPMGVKINLEDIGVDPARFLRELSAKLAQLFEAAYEISFEPSARTRTADVMAAAALELQVLDISYRRLFVVGVIEAFQRLKENGSPLEPGDARALLRSTAKRLEEKEKEDVERDEF